MRDSEGNLLIGGLTLKQLHVELLEEHPDGAATEWLLSGRLTLGPQEQDLLEVGRRYRLQLPDGRAGQVIIASMNRYGHSVVAEFHPEHAGALG
jgi:hypothetical protein